ncbi:hypothetical protein J6590_078393 [Homalodisca vitripennis]|nr:hypothetical protein J6590_078393 [Homalodisca vitripennis]
MHMGRDQEVTGGVGWGGWGQGHGLAAIAALSLIQRRWWLWGGVQGAWPSRHCCSLIGPE